MKKNIKIKNAIFNDHVYSKTKKTLTISFIIFVFLLRVYAVEKIIGFTIVIALSTLFVIYYLVKIFFYNTKRSIKDIILLIIFFLLSVYGVYTIYSFSS